MVGGFTPPQKVLLFEYCPLLQPLLTTLDTVNHVHKNIMKVILRDFCKWVDFKAIMDMDLLQQ
jgi:hypothetical protein